MVSTSETGISNILAVFNKHKSSHTTMKKVRSAALLVVVLVTCLLQPTFAFTVFDSTNCKALLCHGRSIPTLSTTFRRRILQHSTDSTASFHGAATATTAMKCAARKTNNDDKISVSYDGVGRGRYILVLVLFICIWQFSIPPTFRRAKFCPPACAKERTMCRNQCVTVEEWTTDIAEYYRNGGGIQWDFSIDPNTLAENKQFVENLFGNK